MDHENPEILHDLELEGVLVEGLSIGQIRRLKQFYQYKTGDMDLEKLEFYTKGFK